MLTDRDSGFENARHVAEWLGRSLEETQIDAPGAMMALAAVLGTTLRTHVPAATRQRALHLLVDEIVCHMTEYQSQPPAVQ